MKTLAFSPGKAGPLPTYLSYLFLRFPGALGPEESWSLDCVDTYDRRWTTQGRVWVRRADSLTLVAPPSLFSLETDPAAFGFQAPLTIGKVVVKVRPLSFEAGRKAIEGQVLRVGREAFLILKESSGAVDALVAALVADGLVPVTAGEGWWVQDKGPGFVGAAVVEAAPDDPADAFLLGQLKDGLRVARQYEKGIRGDVDTECLHRYRVQLRRVRSLASLGHLWQLVPEWTRLKNLLKLLQQKTNELRDLDVLLLDLPGLAASLPWDEGTRLEGWRETLVHRRKAELRAVKGWLGSQDHEAVLDEIGRLFDDLARFGEPWTMGEWASSSFRRSAQGLRKVLRALGSSPADEALHEVRIRAKRLRSVLDTLGFLGPGEVKTLVTLLKQSQDGLGRFQDRSILLDRLRVEVAALRTGKAGVDAVALGILVGTLAADHGAQKALALDDARRLGSKGFLKALARLVPPEPSDGP